ncbi:protein involved in gliding motility RemB [Flavobacteriaceae bacterium MAR_2010_188]|nr:protein involved in gliding motility RemB [Flavobacteriaceae bacterium MAR_2010_188]
MNKILLLFLLISGFLSYSQNIDTYEKSPVFPECENEAVADLKTCFNNKINQFIFENFDVPQKVDDEKYKGDIKVLFEVDKEGQIKVLYVDAIYDELKEETTSVFSEIPKLQPGTYNGRPIYFQYSLTIKIPLEDPATIVNSVVEQSAIIKEKSLEEVISEEYDSVSQSLQPYKKLEYSSQLNIPFTHSYYSRFDANMNMVGTNSHTAAKPFLYDDVAKYYDFKAEKESMIKGSDAWWERKLWNEHLVRVQSDDYWFVADPIFDLQVGKDSEADFDTTFNNTRGIIIQGGLGNKLNFSASVFESQGRFAQYYNEYAESIKAQGPDPVLIPGRGIAKQFKDDAYDYPVAEAYLSYSPASVFNVQFGHGKNFIGDGYRSLFQSDFTSPYTFLKLNTDFWKIKYTNTWMWLSDVRPEVISEKTYKRKYMANHYLSINVSKKLNVGLFESVIWTNTNDRGFDANYLNPIIFYRAIEFETGQGAGNAILGASAKYKFNSSINFYSQFVLDEFSLGDVKGGNKSWKNKFGYQIGAKYYNAFKVEDLMLQLEYNRVRPYTYSHNTIVLNYGHANQPMAHLLGANFSEFIVIGRYNYKRWYGDAKFIFGKRGFDFDSENGDYYGGDIYRTENDRVGDTGIKVGQGNTTNVFHGEVQAGYIINPVTNLKLFTNLIYRDFDPIMDTASTHQSSTFWFSIGLRTDLFNWYFDL